MVRANKIDEYFLRRGKVDTSIVEQTQMVASLLPSPPKRGRGQEIGRNACGAFQEEGTKLVKPPQGHGRGRSIFFTPERHLPAPPEAVKEFVRWASNRDRKPSRSIGGSVLSRRVPINFEFFHSFASKGEFDFLQVNLIGLLLASLFLPSSAQASNEGSNWPQWRGPDSQGISAEKGLPTEWDTEKNIMWKTPIAGRGHSSPIVWNNRIFLTTSLEGSVVPGAKAVKHMQGNEEFVHPDSMGADRSYTLKLLCLDRDSGEILWERTAYKGTLYDNRHKKNTYASPTPATDGRYVFAFFGSEGAYCYDLDGRPVWKAMVGKIATLGMGVASSPVPYENLVILQCDEDNGDASFMVALDKGSGRQVWRTPRKIQVSWATPIVVYTTRRAELVASGNEMIFSYDPANGTELWHCKGLESNAIATPVAQGGMVYLSAGFPEKRTLAIRLGQSGDLTGTPDIAWRYDKGTAYVPSPILYRDYLYLMSDKGILTCLNAMTGDVKYEGGRVPVPATFSASPVAIDDKILLTSEEGDTFVIKAGPVHEVVRTNSLGEPVYASPAIAHGKIFIRGERHLYCIGSKTKS
jgi:outer membrane protein assembly factor BamB